MKKLFILLFSFLTVLTLVSCKNDSEPIRVDNNETEQIDNLSEGTAERLTYLRNKASESESRWSIFDLFDGLLLMEKASVDMDVATDASPKGNEPSLEGESSKTNVIVEGVDEADYIKNDNRYVYLAKTWYQNTLVVVDANTLDKVEYSFETEEKTDEDNDVIKPYYYGYRFYSNYIAGMYLNDDYLTVIIQNGTDIIVKKFNNSNPLDLKLEDEYSFSNAYYSDSRMIDDKLIIMYQTRIFKDNNLVPMEYQINENKNQIDYDNIIIFEEQKCRSCYYGDYTTSISTIDFDTEDIKVKSLYGVSGYDYSVSKNNIYLINSGYDYENEETSTDIYRFEIDSLELKGKVKQNGTLNNMFSIDEYNGILRVATSDTYDMNNYKNYLSTYDISSDSFTHLDTITFAPGEKIYSASFEGDLGYVVTYLYIDPLFEFDLSNPSDIKILRQLKSPGVSDYLDYINEDLILGIGRITTEHNNGDYTYATSDGVKLSLFSLDNEEMKEEYTKAFDYEYSYTEAQYNHKSVIKLENSLTYFIPFYHYSSKVVNKNVSYENFYGVLAFRVDKTQRKINIIGELEASESYRMCVVNGKLFVISNNSLLVVNVTDNLEVVDTIK